MTWNLLMTTHSWWRHIYDDVTPMMTSHSWWRHTYDNFTLMMTSKSWWRQCHDDVTLVMTTLWRHINYDVTMLMITVVMPCLSGATSLMAPYSYDVFPSDDVKVPWRQKIYTSVRWCVMTSRRLSRRNFSAISLWRELRDSAWKSSFNFFAFLTVAERQIAM